MAAVRHWAPVAAREAAVHGAHRQAVAHWARALAHCEPSAERAALLDASAEDVHMSVGIDESIAVRSEAARLWCAHGRPDNAAVSLARQSLMFLYAARNADAAAALREARSLVADQPRSHAARVVRSCAASLCLFERDYDEAIALATSVLDEAERDGDAAETVACLKTIGRAQLVAGPSRRGHRDARACTRAGAGWQRESTRQPGLRQPRRGLCRRVQACRGARRGCARASTSAPSATSMRRGCTRRHGSPTRCCERARWDEAAAAAHAVIAAPKATVIARIAALVALGRLRARRGDPGVWSALDEARDLAAGAGPGGFHVARAEAAWLEGRDRDAARDAAADLAPAIAARRVDPRRATVAVVPARRRRGDADPRLLRASTRSRSKPPAAGRTRLTHGGALGCPFETARALAHGDEPAQRQALAMFEALGARPMVERVRQRLRAAGVRGLPRGARRSTREHPAGLTDKEVAVLELLAAGLRNKEIALRLHRSARTVEHHLAAIFVKLGVATRAEAVSAAYRLGVVAAGSASA